jgi:aliphatic sulfonates family ABC transporter substrate-binding protein
MVARRTLLAALAATGIARANWTRAGQALRVGFQKGEPVLMIARQNRILETLLNPIGIDVQWLEFQFGPPMLEAMRVGSVDIGGVGDTPPVFAQAAHSDLLYVAAQRSGGSAILVPDGSPLRTLHDLKGKRVAFGRGSSAHNLTVAALELAGLAYTDIQPIYLGPADAGAAFERGAIDAWTIWDPYYALFETRPGVRVLAKWTDIVEQNSFYMARRAYVAANPTVIAKVVAALTDTATWARSHRPEVAIRLSEATGIPVEAVRRAVDRAQFVVLPMDDALADSQQKVADRFRRIGMLPNDIRVSEDVWKSAT